MRTVIIKLPAEADFSSEMAEMREWLDKHRCAPSRFKYDLAQDTVNSTTKRKLRSSNNILTRGKTISSSVGDLGQN
jgi:hypothetical protein